MVGAEGMRWLKLCSVRSMAVHDLLGQAQSHETIPYSEQTFDVPCDSVRNP